MSDPIVVATQEILPTPQAVLRAQGVRDDAKVSAQARAVAEEAVALCARLLEPRALLQEIDDDTFAPIFYGEGHNESPAPLDEILPQAQHLALIVATVGQPICDEIAQRFADQDLALAAALDAAASEAAENLSEHLEFHFDERLAARGQLTQELTTRCYCPGYCGWHIGAQRQLFVRLAPERIGITLRDSCLMQPLKSVSGVLVQAPAAAHRIQPRYGFCSSCCSKSCVSPARQRLIDRENTA